MKRKSVILRALYKARDFRSKALFDALRKHCRGHVLDVGGWDFYLTAREERIPFEHWTTLEYSTDRLLETEDSRVTVVYGDGCDMDFDDASFDTVLNVQVLEHVFEPLRMVSEISRVLKPGGTAVFLVPQTSTTHLAPHYYSNFSRFWIREAMRRNELEIIELESIGGVWTTMASHLFFFILQSFRVRGMSTPENRRNAFFYLLYPVMLLFALVNIPLALLLSLGDLSE